MITTKTVFVLGAGASAPYGYPTGQQLTGWILQNLASSQHSCVETLLGRFDANHIETFRRELHHSRRYSVDAFLEHRPEFLDVGRAAIAWHLLGLENPEALSAASPEQDWYRYLVHNLLEASDVFTFARNDISFVTFNYDRSLEEYLFTAIRSSFGLKDAEAATLLKQIQFIHVHGDLGQLPWQDVEEPRPYAQVTTLKAVDAAAKRIKIVHEDPDGKGEQFQRARSLIYQAERVVALGFGFSEPNVRRIGLNSKVEGPMCVGTCLGMGDAELLQARGHTAWQFTLYPDSCLELLRNRPSFR